MDDEIAIDYQRQVQCDFRKESETYSCKIQLVNRQSHALYFYVVSTFGLYLKQIDKKRQIQANSNLELEFTFKPTNMISPNNENIVFYISNRRISGMAPCNFSKQLKVHLKFNEQFVEDPRIDQLVRQEVNHLENEAKKLRYERSFAAAKNKYEEGFQLMRKQHRCLYGMAKCGFQLQSWEDALRDICTALLFSPQNYKYQFLKVRILLNYCKNVKGWEEDIIEQCYAKLKQIHSFHRQSISHNDKKQLQKLLQHFNSNPYQSRLKALKKELIKKALLRYSSEHPLSHYFERKQIFDFELRRILLCEEQQQNSTPEEVVDPINYQIMEHPYIIPSGNSYEGKSLQMYFIKNGYKDPISRTQLQPTWVFTNNNLESYIKNHHKLKIWKQYQYDLINK